ncbi:MAG: PIG-L family deacetylase [Chloroflexi bacterium]|nr:PIG-L family deacetylase [Chloroflexota bacterium]
MAQRRLMCILAHPDDESMGLGATLARYAAEGVTISLVTATRGERGWQGPPADNPGLATLGHVRETELRAAARVLGLDEVHILDHIDGDLDQAVPTVALPPIVGAVRRARPQVVVTFGPDGAYGHPDHIAISQLASAAVVAAADPTYADPGHQPPHRVAKLYYVVDSEAFVARITRLLGGPLTMAIDGVERGLVAWPDWAITTRIDAITHWRTAWQAVQCHRSQLATLGPLVDAPDEVHQAIWGIGTFYRVFSLVNGGRALEHDLFAGLP